MNRSTNDSARFCVPVFTLFLLLTSTGILGAKKNIDKIIFEEQRIEGKIRRPQLVLIQAEMRPEFEPMVMESFSAGSNIVRSVDQSIIEKSPYDGAFQFNRKEISNYKP